MALKSLALLAAILTAVVAAPLTPAADAWTERIDPRLLDELGGGASQLRVIAMTDGPSAGVAAAALGMGAGVSYVYDLIDGFAATVAASNLRQLANLEGVSYVWQDAPTYVTVATSRIDVGIPTVEGQGWTGSGVRVALIDTGVNPVASSMGGLNPSSPGLANKVAICRQYLGGVAAPVCLDNHGHGTHTASTVTSVAPTARGMATGTDIAVYRTITDAGTGLVSDSVAALNHIVSTKATNGIRVISMSIGAGGGSGTGPLSVAADNAFNNGFVVVASAGNSGPASGTVLSPADAFNVIAVGAVAENDRFSNTDDTIASFSSRGPTTDGRVKPEIVAPGVSITANCVAILFCTLSGTSMAAPHVAGIAALVLQKHPTWTPTDVRNALLSTAVKQSADPDVTPNNNYGYGLVSAPGALSL